MIVRRATLAAMLALALAAFGVGSPAAAQQASLSSAASAVAGFWSRGNADGLAEMLSRSGVALHLFDESHPAAGVRQARAALAQLLEKRGGARVTRVEELGGSPQRGFAEIGWDVSAPGSADGLRYVVFVGFVRADDGWRIAEIRVLR